MESSTRARDLVAIIADTLKLKKSDGFAVFVKVADKGTALWFTAMVATPWFTEAGLFRHTSCVHF